MRGRSLWRDRPCSTICAFRDRLGAAQCPWHGQRRFLQSSSRASKPPATAAALPADDERSIAQHTQSNSQPSGTLRGGFGRQPAFGSASPSAAGSSSGWTKPVFGSGVIELTDEERQARDLINENAERQQRRLVDVHPQPGPESNRAGRPIPVSREEAMERYRRRAESQPRFRITKHVYGAPPIEQVRESQSETSSDNGHSNDQVQNWGQLRRRGTTQESQSSSISGNPFIEGRTQREEESRFAQYTPLRPRVIDKANYNDPNIAEISQEQASFSERPVKEMGPETRSEGTQDECSTAASTLSTENSQQQGLSVRRIVLSFDDDVRDRLVRSVEVPKPRTIRHLRAARQIDKSEPEPVTIRQVPGSSARFDNLAPEPVIVRQLRLQSASQTIRQLRSATQINNSAPEPETIRQVQWSSARFNNSVQEPRTTDTQIVENETQSEDHLMKRAAKYAIEDASKSKLWEESPRGLQRDKARRRDQFIAEDENAQEFGASKAVLKKDRKREKFAKKAAMPTPILLPEYISVANLAAVLRVGVDDLIKKMEELGFEETGYDHILNGENAGLIAMEYNFEPLIDREMSEDLRARPAPEDESNLPSRPPVVTIMGHVDHGKTTLLDWLRKSSVAATEYGGITQHIGAFSVPMPSGKMITFLDTPGHAAFLSMRQRGANVTDVVILVVAADDSVKPQTIEAINHAKAAKVPIIVAINKVDKEEVNIDRVKQDLARHGIEIEDFGGDTQVVCVSGKTGQGMEELEDAILTLSEILDMRAEQDGPAEGWVLEASIKSMGKVATVLVRRGTMRPGDFIVAGNTWARIRCLRNEAGTEITEAGPGMPVEIDGWKVQPLAGDEVLQAPTESKAKSVVEYRLEREERDKMAVDIQAINEARKIEQEKREREKVETKADAADTVIEETCGPKQIQFIVKGDVSGSVEAVVDSISSIGNAEIQSHVLRSGVGQLSEFDVEHAAAARGCLVNFNTSIDPHIARQARAAKVKIIDHNIIYRLVDEVKATMSEHLPPLITQKVLGEADVSQIFDITIKGRHQKPVAGCKVRNGTMSKNAKIRLLRDGKKIFDGAMESLKNVKKDVTEMRKGSECGICIEGWSDIQVGDQIQCYETKEEKRYL